MFRGASRADAQQPDCHCGAVQHCMIASLDASIRAASQCRTQAPVLRDAKSVTMGTHSSRSRPKRLPTVKARYSPSGMEAHSTNCASGHTCCTDASSTSAVCAAVGSSDRHAGEYLRRWTDGQAVSETNQAGPLSWHGVIWLGSHATCSALRYAREITSICTRGVCTAGFLSWFSWDDGEACVQPIGARTWHCGWRC